MLRLGKVSAVSSKESTVSRLDDLNEYIETLKQDKPTPRQKLSIIGNESVRPLATIKGFAQIIKLKVDPETPGLPTDFAMWVDSIIEASTYLETILKVIRIPENDSEQPQS
jgi:hypothetical protein